MTQNLAQGVKKKIIPISNLPRVFIDLIKSPNAPLMITFLFLIAIFTTYIVRL